MICPVTPPPPNHHRSPHAPTTPARATLPLAAAITILALTLLPACAKKPTVIKANPIPQAPALRGPAFLHGTVGSLTTLRGYQPLLVSGYGVVVNLPGTGSADVPAYLRQWLLNEMRKKGIGSPSSPLDGVSPQQLLASPNTAVVRVRGLIPPGATKGTRFDVQVDALPQTQTTSLAGGQLWTAALSISGDNPAARYTRTLAEAQGDLYTNPFDTRSPREQALALRRTAAVLSGGVATADQPLAMTLNQPSWQRSRLIADRINERFPRGGQDRLDAAIPTSDVRITLNIPRRFAADPEHFLGLVSHLYTQRAPRFNDEQANRLAELIAAPDATDQLLADAALAWQAMGKTVLPTIRKLYAHPAARVRLTALETGARLLDEATTDALLRDAQLPDPALRARVAQALAALPRSLRGARILHALLSDDEQSVRVAAYESLARINDPIIRRIPVGDRDNFKFILDLVPADRPMIYLAQARVPRLVIFGPTLGFNTPTVARLWDNRLMIRAEQPGQPLSVYYQSTNAAADDTHESGPTVAALAMLLAHRPTRAAPDDGLDLSYSQVANAIFELCQQGAIDAPIHLQVSPLAQAIARSETAATTTIRPETDPADPQPNPQPAPPPDAPPDPPSTIDPTAPTGDNP